MVILMLESLATLHFLKLRLRWTEASKHIESYFLEINSKQFYKTLKAFSLKLEKEECFLLPLMDSDDG